MRDFSQPAQQAAACKNAYVLLAQHQAELAASFFILGALLLSKCPFATGCMLAARLCSSTSAH